jgi:DNA-binding NarL/FixJ family response regulator
VARVDALRQIAHKADTHALSARERQVIELVATGKTNREIARQLSISERTVDRHVSNILLKLNLPTRSAATAYAYQNDLIARTG